MEYNVSDDNIYTDNLLFQILKNCHYKLTQFNQNQIKQLEKIFKR